MLEGHVVREVPLAPALLQTLFLFEALDVEHLEEIACHGVLVDYSAGPLFREGDPARYFYALVDGELRLSKNAGGREVETMRTSHRGAYCGATSSFLAEPPAVYGFSVMVTRPTQMVRLSAKFMGEFIRTHYPLAVHLLQGMHVDHESVHQIVDQQRRIQAASTMTAGLMHGLNNPAGAIARIASELGSRQKASSRDKAYQRLSTAAAEVCDRFVASAPPQPDNEIATGALTALQRIDREELVDDWLSAHHVEHSWEKAPTIAAIGLSVEWLQSLADALAAADAGAELGDVISAVTERMDSALLVSELASASAEISTIVASAQQYSQLDGSPMTSCNVNDLLESTLTMLSARLRDDDVRVERDYAPTLPPLLCYAGELNQAWTNILDNALDAIRATPTPGVISVRTAVADRGVIRVEIADNGMGVDAAIRDRIFLPFFTTKPVGQGIGMGLDMAWRTIVGLHHGSLGLTATPGDTRFIACLPRA